MNNTAICFYLYISYIAKKKMSELIDRLVNEAGLTPEQSQKAIEVIAAFVKEQFPMIGGAVDQIFPSNS